MTAIITPALAPPPVPPSPLLLMLSSALASWLLSEPFLAPDSPLPLPPSKSFVASVSPVVAMPPTAGVVPGATVLLLPAIFVRTIVMLVDANVVRVLVLTVVRVLVVTVAVV